MNGGREFSQAGGGRPVWLVTFADLVALLIAFFVMLFATQKVDSGKWDSLTDAFSLRLNPTQTVIIARPTADRNAERLSPDRAIDLDYLEVVIRDKMKIQPELAGLSLFRREDRLVVALPAELLFALGRADIVADARPILFALAGVLGTVGNHVDIVGHADPAPIRDSHFGTNWQLSIARAVSVANELRRSGYHRRLSPAGYGDTRFTDLPPDIPAALRDAVARRVDIVIWPTREAR
ncbi:MAG: flagellar motor protein MotB [Rhodospirillaceae bacterium]